MAKFYVPAPVFDTLVETVTHYKALYDAENPRALIKQWLNHCLINTHSKIPAYAVKDYQAILHFLYAYRGSQQTFNAYRRDCERLLQWSWFVREQSLLKHKRDDIEAFIEFCIKPYKRWIGIKQVARFKIKLGEKIPNPDWRPFGVSLKKTANKTAKLANKDDYNFSQKSLKALFAVLGSFYQYCLQEDWATANPVSLIRQKSKFIQKDATAPTIRRLTPVQWKMVIECAKEKAIQDRKYEREVFLLSCLYSMYLRISELTASERWIPTMGDFYQDSDKNWWFKTIGKGNKARQIAVSNAMIVALKHYRTTYLELPPYPAIGEKTPLIGQLSDPNKSINNGRSIRYMIQACFDNAAGKLEPISSQEAKSLQVATVHWLRHTGISDDVKTRPREHVRDDAGHSSGAITDRYIDVELMERAKSAKLKPIEAREPHFFMTRKLENTL